jgi:peptidoglycan/LPS O-acetylase OafA/YrhL
MGFLRRRFWRIVPPYWAALIIAATLIGAGLYSPDNSGAFGIKDFLIHALLLQDAVGNTSPNGAFWSIAVEWHIYFLFPLVLLGFRRTGIKIVLPATAALIVVQHVIGQLVPVVGMLDRFTPAYLLLFVAGASAAWLSERQQGRLTAMWTSMIFTACALAFVLASGSENAVRNYFWLDIAVGIATAALFLAAAQGRFRWLTSFLALPPLAFLGSFAFSLYLIHAPVLAMLNDLVVRPLALGAMESLILLLVSGSVASVAAAYAFFLLFERPFLTIRSYRELVESLRSAFLAAGPEQWRLHRRSTSRPKIPERATLKVEVTEK